MRPQAAAAVILHKSSLMQQIQDHVRVGYRFWTAGVVEANRAEAWAHKAHRLYGVYLDRNRRARAKRRGEGCAVLLLHELNSPGQLFWILLVTTGDHIAHQLETLNDASDRSSRISLDSYELCYLTKPGASRPVLTWRMTRPIYESWRADVIDTVRRGDGHAVEKLIYSLHRAPGFYGVRLQVKACRELIRGTSRRARPNAPLPKMPSRVFYLRRRTVLKVPLRTWVASKAHVAQTEMEAPPEGGASSPVMSGPL